MAWEPRLFYQRLDSTLGELGYKRYSADWAIWIHDEGGLLGCHMDDVTAIGTREEITKVRTHLHNIFGIHQFIQ